jgi:hypothetical protein
MADPNLKEWATDRQAEIIDAVIEHGSHRKASAALGVHNSYIDAAMSAVKSKAARAGYAPGHFSAGVAPGYAMGKVTIQRSAAGVERVWERQSPQQGDRLRDIEAMVDAGFRVKLKRLGKGKHPAPAALPVDPEPG